MALAAPAPAQPLAHLHPGPQTEFSVNPADIIVFGGQAGGGKSFALLYEPLNYAHVHGFQTAIFRRTYKRITAPGALWDESVGLYGGLINASPRRGALVWELVHDSGAVTTVTFAHLEHETNALDWKGAQVPLIEFDQLEEFSSFQFWYLTSRNRTALPIRPRIRATANPQPGWLADLLQWWWDPETGYPIPERSGRLRWFVRLGEEIVWGATKQELVVRFGADPDRVPRSLCFIRSTLADNPTIDPGYRATLAAMSTVERERLLYGNWKIAYTAGTMFGTFEIVDAAPARALRVRYWDEAATHAGGDWTAGVRISRSGGLFYVEDVVRGQWETAERDRVMRQTAELDATLWGVKGERNTCGQLHQQEPGSSGKDRARGFARLMAGFPVRVDLPTGDKVARADPYSAQVQAGNVRLVRGEWNRNFIDEHLAFPAKEAHDDQVDAASGAFNILARAPTPSASEEYLTYA